MRRAGWVGRLAGAVAAGVVSFAAIAADRISLKDGREFVGRVVSENEREVKFEAVVSNIRTILTFERREVASIEKNIKGVEEGAGAPAPPAPAPGPGTSAPAPGAGAPKSGGGSGAGPKRADDGVKKCLTIPITGVIGEEALSDGVREALQWAARSGVTEIEFRINSPGGLVDDAEKMTAAMKEFDDKLRYHAVIESAMSATMWIISLCDTVFMTDAAATGAAVAFSIDVKTGAAQVDAKFLSAIAATLASNAESKGRSGAVFRAMVVPEAELYKVTDPSGEVTVVGEAPPKKNDGTKVERLDDNRRVLTLTAEEAVACGLARRFGDGDNLGVKVEGAEWKSAGEIGAQAMQKHARRAAEANKKFEAQVEKAKKLAKDMDDLIDVINRTHGEARSRDPRAVQNYYYDKLSGQMTPASQQDWRRNSQTAITAWSDVIEGLRRLEKMQQEWEKITGKRWLGKIEIRAVAAEVEKELSWLKANLNRTSPP